MEIQNVNTKINQVKPQSESGAGLAKEIVVFADDYSSAVMRDDFKKKLTRMEKLSNWELINFIRGFKEESVIETICDEVGCKGDVIYVGGGKYEDVRKNACKRVLYALVAQADALGIDTKGLQSQFIKELNSQFNSWGTIDTGKLDNIINGLVQSIENRLYLTQENIEK